MKQPMIAVDVDDVLADHVSAFIDFSNENYGTALTRDDYDIHWSELWVGADHQEIERRALEFHTYESVMAYAKVQQADQILRRLQPRYELVIVTARPKHLVPATEDWIAAHFPGVFSAIHFVPIWEPDNTVTKGDICQQIGADYLIDDVVQHCNLAAAGGVTALLFGEYAWNRQELDPAVVRVKDWLAVAEHFNV